MDREDSPHLRARTRPFQCFASARILSAVALLIFVIKISKRGLILNEDRYRCPASGPLTAERITKTGASPDGLHRTLRGEFPDPLKQPVPAY